MFPVADWSRRKLEIADAFREAAPLPAEADETIYQKIIAQIGVSNNQDIRSSILSPLYIQRVIPDMVVLTGYAGAIVEI